MWVYEVCLYLSICTLYIPPQEKPHSRQSKPFQDRKAKTTILVVVRCGTKIKRRYVWLIPMPPTSLSSCKITNDWIGLEGANSDYGGFFKENPQPATRIFGNIVYAIFPMCCRAVEHSGLIKLMNLYCFLCGSRAGQTTTTYI